MSDNFKVVKRMTLTMRLTHWVTALSVLATIITGLYIGHPYYQTLIADPAVDKYVMAWNRLIHFIAAIILDVTAIYVAYHYLIEDVTKPWQKILPTGKNFGEFLEVTLNLLTLNRRKKFDSAHMDSFNAVWFTLLHIMLILMLFTGLQLYVHGLASGHSAIGAWWPALLHLSTDWTLYVFGGKMGVRITHHMSMWLIVVWAACHLYVQIWRTVFWQEGDMAIVFGGSKFAKEERK